MKKLLLYLAFILASLYGGIGEAQYIRTNCANIAATSVLVPYASTCRQTTTVAGRFAGKSYVWNGTAWIDAEIPPVVTVATLPATPTEGQLVTVSDGLTAGACETGGGTNKTTCRWNSTSGHWESVVPTSGSSSLQVISDVGRTINNAVDTSTAVKVGNGTVYVLVYCDSANVCKVVSDVASDKVISIVTNKNFVIHDEEAVADMWIIDPDAASPNAMYTIASGYRPRKSVYFSAGALSTDGTQCVAPAEVTINSGAKRWTIICADNDASTIYGEVEMPDAWDGGVVTLMGSFIQTAANTAVMNSDVAMACRGTGTTINNTWGTEVAMDIAAMTGSNAIDKVTTGSITPNGTCTGGGKTLQFRWQLDATGTTTAVATLHVVGFKLEYTVSSLSD